MHEMGLVYDLLQRIENCSRGERVARIHIEVNLVAGIDIEELRHLFNTYAFGGVAEKARLLIQVVEPPVRCTRCGYSWSFSRRDYERLVSSNPRLRETLHVNPRAVLDYLVCPRCGSNRLSIDSWTARVRSLQLFNGAKIVCE